MPDTSEGFLRSHVEVGGTSQRFKELCHESVERYQTPHAQSSGEDTLAAVADDCARGQSNRHGTGYGKPNAAGEQHLLRSDCTGQESEGSSFLAFFLAQ